MIVPAPVFSAPTTMAGAPIFSATPRFERAVGLAPTSERLDAASKAPEAAAGPSLAVTVELDPALADQLAPGATLYVFARTLEGGLPVAVKRLPAESFPVTVSLSDADGLMPAQKLSGQARVRLMARISRSGDAGASPGDLEAEVLELDVADGANATLVIAKVVQ